MLKNSKWLVVRSFGFKMYKFHLDYAYSKYALTGNAHTIGITTNLGSFNKK
jgi:hypothetical protein